MQLAAFVVCAVVAVASGAAVFTVDSMARATYALALSFVAVGGSLLLLDLAYLGVVTVLMMVMEMAVMAVFMVMFMMNPAGLMPMSMLHNRRGAAAVSAGVFLALATGALLVPWPDHGDVRPGDPTRAAGRAVMGDKMLVMTGVGAVLFTTIVAALVLAAARSRYDSADDGPDDGASGNGRPHHDGPPDRGPHRDGPHRDAGGDGRHGRTAGGWS